jgi:SAM-dependent methyltransferase
MALRNCPVCDAESSAARLFLEQNFDAGQLTGASFASRKTPEYMCHRLVQCPICDLVYADDPPDQSDLTEAYEVAEFDSAREADDAADAYDRAIAPILARLDRTSALEIGTGTGVFLDALLKRGFRTVTGVEPSVAAIAAAPSRRRSLIRHGIFSEWDFEPRSFDLICCFMTLEHVREPRDLVGAAMRLLRPGGAVAIVTHDYRSWVNQLLGKRSPIIDIEHLQLFSRKSMRVLLDRSGFESVSLSGFSNRYALSYWLRLLPLWPSLKHALIGALGATRATKLKIDLNVGNFLSVGYRCDK